MKCPYCGSDKLETKDSRGSGDDSIRRRKECLNCNKRFTTYETIKLKPVKVIKRNGSLEDYDRKKIEAGILRAIHKRKVMPSDMEKLLDNIDEDIFSENSDSISVDKIGDIILKHLKKIDDVAYIRFASIYKNFNDVEEFIKEIKSL